MPSCHQSPTHPADMPCHHCASHGGRGASGLGLCPRGLFWDQGSGKGRLAARDLGPRPRELWAWRLPFPEGHHSRVGRAGSQGPLLLGTRMVWWWSLGLRRRQLSLRWPHPAPGLSRPVVSAPSGHHDSLPSPLQFRLAVGGLVSVTLKCSSDFYPCLPSGHFWSSGLRRESGEKRLWWGGSVCGAHSEGLLWRGRRGGVLPPTCCVTLGI